MDRPENHEAIGSRFVLRNKYAQDGKLEKRKARIVARGFSQQPGVDFHETYAPVARLKSIRLAMALAAHREMYIHQFDITTAYLNGTLEEKVYMEIPDYMEEILKYIIREERRNKKIAEKAKKMLDDLLDGDKVYLMRKALYGLCQAGRVWHERLDREIRKFGAKSSNDDPCIYLKNGGDQLIIIIVYVDDILIISPNTDSIVDFREHLRRSFDVSDLGELKYCLGLDFERLNDGIHMSQATYINDILRIFEMLDCNPVSTPLDASVKMAKIDPWEEHDGDRPPYRELVGALLYRFVATRPNIAHAASLLSQYKDCFGRTHWAAAKRVLRYLKGTTRFGILFGSRQSPLTGFVDADWGGSVDDRRSFTGYAFTWNGGIISWESKKQKTVALSSTESEYTALGQAAKEAV